MIMHKAELYLSNFVILEFFLFKYVCFIVYYPSTVRLSFGYHVDLFQK